MLLQIAAERAWPFISKHVFKPSNWIAGNVVQVAREREVHLHGVRPVSVWNDFDDFLE